MTVFRKVNILDSDDVEIDPAKQSVQDTIEDLLKQILIQLKILTLHQEIATGEKLTEEDVESL